MMSTSEHPASAQLITAETPPKDSPTSSIAPAERITARVLALPLREQQPPAEFFRPLGAAADVTGHVRVATQLLELAYQPGAAGDHERDINDKIVRSAVTRLWCALRALVASVVELPDDPPLEVGQRRAARELSPERLESYRTAQAFWNRADQISREDPRP